MGWSGALVMIGKAGPPPMAEPPVHDPAQALAVADGLDLGRFEAGEMVTLEDAFSIGLAPEEACIGAYGDAALVASWRLVEQLFGGMRPGGAWDRLARMFPGTRMLAFALVSSSNYFAYQWFEDGRIRRWREGSADDGIRVEEGAPLPEELPILAQAEIRDGKRVYRDPRLPDERFTEDAMGEEFVFELARPFFGCRFDEHEQWEDIPLQRFGPPKRRFPVLKRSPHRPR